MIKVVKHLTPAWLLLFLSPVVGELLSGSAPPAEFFNPLAFVMLAILYGGGAVLVRESAFWWGKAWLAIPILGAAYGIAEEGLMCKSFFDPAWMDLGLLATYGRWAGVNWVWVFELTIYHAAFSVMIPMVLTEAVFPAWRGRGWISRRTFLALAILWVVNGMFIFFFVSTYRPPMVHFLVSLATVVGLCILAWKLPVSVEASFVAVRRGSDVNRFWFWLTGFLGTVSLFLLVWVLPHMGLHPVGTILLMVALVIVVAWLVLRMACRDGLSDGRRLAVASGALCFFILLAPLQELSKSRTDNPAGMSIVGLAMGVFLVWAVRRVRRLEQCGNGIVNVG